MKATTALLLALVASCGHPAMAQPREPLQWPPQPIGGPSGMPGYPLNDYYTGQLIGAATPKLTFPTTTTCVIVDNISICQTR